ncbi:MAG: hybrid sensor histidine kinase/response regulator [Campylobacterota bacterium]|nr:hybrid sensor histidine kinase/response regulator [Campylobacterota bacterium]
MNKSNILIVDDTETNIDILVDLLGDQYEILVALNGETALEILKTEHVDLILLDIMMPGLNGYDVCKELKQNDKTKDIPVIFLTAMSDEASIEKAFELGGVDYVMKPFRPKELIARVKTQLNITYLKNKDKEYKKQKAVGELLHNIVHHWRQPLSAISTTASGISVKNMIGELDNTGLDKMCDDIVAITASLSSTLESLEVLANVSDIKEKINLSQFIDKNYDIIFDNLIKMKNVEVLLDIDKDLILDVNSQQLIKVLISVLENSKDIFKFEDINNPIVGINAWKEDDKVMIQIFDNAGGISEDIIDRIFEPYFTTFHKSEGKGLGLFYTQKIISEFFGGYISVSNIKFDHNTQAHKGASFIIELT